MATFTPYSTTLPSGLYNLNDLVFASLALGMPKPDLVQSTGGLLTFGYLTDPVLAPALLSSWGTTIASNPTPQTPARVRSTLEDKVVVALTTNNTYLAIGAPSSAQNTAQVKALTRQVNALGRMLLGLLDTTAGT